MKKSRPKDEKTKKFNMQLFLISFVIGMIGEMLVLIYVQKAFPDRLGMQILYIFIALFLFFIFTFPHVIIHEAGHLMFGLLTGYSFISFRIGSLTIVRENGKLKRKKFSIPGTAGQCLLAPPDMVNGTFPYQLYNYGGVIMGFTISIIIILILFLLPDLSIIADIMFGSFAFSGIVLSLTNGIPMDLGIPNDGLNVKNMRKDEFARKAFYLQLDINAKQSRGIRLKDMPAEWFALPESADLTNMLIVYIKFMEYYRYLDQLDFTKAQQCLNELESVAGRLPRIYRSIYNLEQFFSSIIDENGRSKAEKYITKETKAAMKAFKNDISIKRIEYTYYFRYMKDTAEAERCLQSAYALAKRYPVPAEAESNMLLIEYVSKQPKFNCEV